jgi:hypothetical protein
MIDMILSIVLMANDMFQRLAWSAAEGQSDCKLLCTPGMGVNL